MPYLLFSHLWIENVYFSTFQQKRLYQLNRCGLSRVAGILLECESKKSNLLSSEGIEESPHNTIGKPFRLVIIQSNNLAINAVRVQDIPVANNLLLHINEDSPIDRRGY